MTTRRKFGLGIAAMLAAQRAPAALVRSLVAGRHIAATGTRLPYDAEVEYLESTGTQWIDTGFRLMLSDVAECKASIGNRNSILGAIDGSRRFNITGGGGDTFAYYPGNGYLGRTATSLNQPYVFTLGDGSFAIDGTVTGTTTYVDFTFTTSCVIFARNIGTGVNDYLSGSIYYFTIRRGGKIVMDLHPVRFTNEFGQTEGAMYDRVSGQLFRNQGTGSFIIGPVKARGASGQNGGGISG